jgi:hypothetical protein
MTLTTHVTCSQQSPLIIIDTTGCGFHEEMVATKNVDRPNKKGAEEETNDKRKPMMLGEGSKANQGEADLVHQYVHILLQQGACSMISAVLAFCFSLPRRIEAGRHRYHLALQCAG